MVNVLIHSLKWLNAYYLHIGKHNLVVLADGWKITILRSGSAVLIGL